MSKEDRRAGTCNFSPGPMTCLSCPFPECTNNRPPVRGEDGVEKYVNLTDGTKENAMKTKYSVGDTVKVGAKIVKIEIDEKGVRYMLSSGFWKGFKEVREGELSSGSSKSAPKTSEKPKKALAKTEKASKNDRKRQRKAAGQHRRSESCRKAAGAKETRQAEQKGGRRERRHDHGSRTQRTRQRVGGGGRVSCEMCTWAVGDYCLKHRNRDLTPCRDFRGISAESKEKTGYIEYLDDTIPEPQGSEEKQ